MSMDKYINTTEGVEWNSEKKSMGLTGWERYSYVISLFFMSKIVLFGE